MPGAAHQRNKIFVLPCLIQAYDGIGKAPARHKSRKAWQVTLFFADVAFKSKQITQTPRQPLPQMLAASTTVKLTSRIASLTPRQMKRLAGSHFVGYKLCCLQDHFPHFCTLPCTLFHFRPPVLFTRLALPLSSLTPNDVASMALWSTLRPLLHFKAQIYCLLSL